MRYFFQKEQRSFLLLPVSGADVITGGKCGNHSTATEKCHDHQEDVYFLNVFEIEISFSGFSCIIIPLKIIIVSL